MPPRHEVEIRVTGETRDVLAKLRQLNRQLDDSRQQFQRDYGELARRARNYSLAIAGAVTGVILTMRELNEEVDAFQASQRRLDAAAKLSGGSLDELQQIAAATRDRFRVSSIQANDLTTAISKLTAKAGDVRRTGDAIAAFLNVGAAQGLTMEQTLTAVQQAILGIDEGTDKLFQKNPSALYQEFAASIGTTVGRLTEQQKAQALVHAAMETSRIVGDKYNEFLSSAAGRQAELNARLSEAKILFGEAIQPARARIMDELADSIERLARTIQENQDTIGGFFGLVSRGARSAPGFFPLGDVFGDLREGILELRRRGVIVANDPRRQLEFELSQARPEVDPAQFFQLRPFRVAPPAAGGARRSPFDLSGFLAPPAVPAATAAGETLPDLAELQQRADVLLSILESRRAAGESTLRVTSELRQVYADVVAVIEAGGDALDKNTAKALKLRDAIEEAFGDRAIRDAKNRIAEMADGLARAAAAAQRIRIPEIDFADRPRAPAPGSLGPGAGLPPIVTPSTRLRELEEEMRLLISRGLGPAFMDPDHLDELIQLGAAQAEAAAEFAEVRRSVADSAIKDTDRMAVSVIGAFGEMASAAIAQGELTASAVIGMLTQIGTAAAAQRDQLLLGGIIGVAGGLLGAVFARDRSTPQPVRIEEYGPRALSQQQDRDRGPQNVIVQVVAPVTGEVIQEIEYRLGRRRRLDAVERLPARGE